MTDFSTKFARVVLAFALLFHGQVFATGVVLPTETRVYIETTEDLVAKGINSIEIANTGTLERVSTRLMVDIEI